MDDQALTRRDAAKDLELLHRRESQTGHRRNAGARLREDATELSKRFDHDDAGQKRVPGKMAVQELFIPLQHPGCGGRVARNKRRELINKAELFAMRKGGKRLDKIGCVRHAFVTTHDPRPLQFSTHAPRPMINQLRMMAATLASGIYWGCGGLSFLMMSWITRFLLPEATARQLGLWMIQVAFAGFVRLLALFRIAQCEYVGFEKLGDAKGGYVLAPNHPAIWDVVFIMAKMGGMTCILKASLFKNPLMSGGARMARVSPNDPPSEMVKRCVKELSEGQRLLLFPEGTRTRKWEGVLNEFRGGVALVAKHANVPVYPLFVQTNSDYGSKRWPAWKAPPETVRIRMTVGEPMLCGPQESSHEFLERLRAAYIAALSAPSS